MKFNYAYIKELMDLYKENAFLHKKNFIKDRNIAYKSYNQLYVCTTRIYETTIYLDKEFKLKRHNTCGEAFDFYELINCISIIFDCAYSLFKIFKLDLEKTLSRKNIFKISKKRKVTDCEFFRFVRSAAIAHPSETTHHSRITKNKIEFYPYAVWIDEISRMLRNQQIHKEADIRLMSWGGSSYSQGKNYYFSTKEFYLFCGNILISLKSLIKPSKNEINKFIEEKRYKRLKSYNDFADDCDYAKYILTKILKRVDKNDPPDANLPLAIHTLQNPIISQKFKKYIIGRINKIRRTMLKDIEMINSEDVFSELNLYDAIKDDYKKEEPSASYISEKFSLYLEREAVREIKNNNFTNIANAKKDQETGYSNREWSIILLLNVKDILYTPKVLKNVKTYADLYEITLQIIYERQKRASP